MKLRYAARALSQIDQAIGYIAVRSPAGADKVQRRLDAIMAAVKLYPRSGRQTSIPGVRRVLLAPYPYAVDYLVRRDEIIVLRFRHTARRPV